MPITTAHKRAEFRRLHHSGCFVLPNPWDVGSARYLQHLGFKALASTSSGFAWSTGRPDNAVDRDDVLAHLAALADAADVPVNADFEGGFAADPEGVAASVSLAVETGIAGLSIEDSVNRRDASIDPLYPLPRAVERIRAAREAIDRIDPSVMLIGRAECFLVGRTDLGETIARLTAYAEAGADCLYAPGIRTLEDVALVVKAVAPKPVNILAGPPGFTVQALADLGVRRISVGGALARSAWMGFMRAAKAIAETGSFAAFAEAVPHAEINGFFSEDFRGRQ